MAENPVTRQMYLIFEDEFSAVGVLREPYFEVAIINRVLQDAQNISSISAQCNQSELLMGNIFTITRHYICVSSWCFYLMAFSPLEAPVSSFCMDTRSTY